MPLSINRRDWLKQSSLAALGLGITIPSIANLRVPLYADIKDGSNMINLGSNENPNGISPHAKQAMISMMVHANRYQGGIPELLNTKIEIAALNNVDASNIIITPGSGEALALFARHFSNGNIVAGKPTYNAMLHTARKIGNAVVEVNLTPEKVHDLDAILAAINNQTAAVFIVNPANPTGTLLSALKLKNFCIEVSKKTTVIVDEAYIDFLDDPMGNSMTDLISNNQNIIILRTFSKIYGLAGLRIGYLLAHPAMVAKLESNYFSHTIYAVSNLSLAAAMAAMKDRDHVKLSKETNANARKYTFDLINSLGIKVIPSETNFLYFNVDKFNGDIVKSMHTQDIVIRSVSNDNGNWARVSIGTMDEMKIFESALRKIYKA